MIKYVVKELCKWIFSDFVPFIIQIFVFVLDCVRLCYTSILPRIFSHFIDKLLFGIIVFIFTYMEYIGLLGLIFSIFGLFILMRKKGVTLFRILIMLITVLVFVYTLVHTLKTSPHIELFKIKDKEYFLNELRERRITLDYASKKLKNNQDFIIELLKIHCGYLEELDPKYKNNKKIVLEVITSNCSRYILDGLLIYHISKNLKDDYDVILKAVNIWGPFLSHASTRIKNNKSIVLAAIKNFWRSLNYASDELKNNKEVVLEAVKQNGIVLKYASNKLKNNKEVVLEAVKSNGHSIKYASLRLQSDEDIIQISSSNVKEGMHTTPDFTIWN